MSKKIYLSPPHMGGDEIEYINQALETNWIAPLGPNVNGFEQDICRYTHSNHCAVLSSGTAAIHLALILLGVGQGDEVLASTFTVSATINPIRYQGATPILIESEADTWAMSPAHLEVAIKDRIAKGKRPKAIILVHLYGMPGKVKEIVEIAARYQIPLIEDAAEALGSFYQGQALGTFGDFGVLSFNGNKIITTSGGGALIAKREQWINDAIHLATQAREKTPHYQHTKVGFNYRMSNIAAGIGRGQMKVLDQWIENKRDVHSQYAIQLADIPGLQVCQAPNPDHFSNFWLTTILIDPSKTNGVTRESIRLHLGDHQIEARPLWKPMHLQPVFQGHPYYGDGLSERLFEIGLCLPSGSDLSTNDLDRITCLICELFNTSNAHE